MNLSTNPATTPPHPEEIWHTQPEADLFSKLNSTPKGLSISEVQSRLNIHGANQLPRAEPPPWWKIAIRQFQSPFVYILAVAAIVSIAIGEFIDASFIFGVLCLNATIGGFQEWKAEKSAQALQKLLQIRATVEREGRVYEVNAEEVVPGDIVWLESGNRVPADLRLLMTHGLEVDESLLTGESIPVSKNSVWSGEPSAPVADRLNMAYAGSIIIRGRSRGIVIATGMKTEIGCLAKAMMEAGSGKPPLIIRMEQFSQTLAWVVMVAIFVVGFLGIMFQGYGVLDMFMFGVALAVAVIPEGLPVALTVALAIGTKRMSECGVIVRRLAAVEGLGSCTMIASDKTGTLTCNELTVKEVYLPNGSVCQVSGQGFAPNGKIIFNEHNVNSINEVDGLESLITAAVLCNEADLHAHGGEWSHRGDPTDIALLSLGQKIEVGQEQLLETYPQVNQIPFEPEYQFSASFHQLPTGQVRTFVKGSPEQVLSMCEKKSIKTILQTVEEMATKGYRVLAFAHGPAPKNLDPHHPPAEPTKLEFLGLTGMIDPLREGVCEAIAYCREAGIDVAIITGDHPVTALTIARDLGLELTPEQVVIGTQLQDRSHEEMQEIVKTARVFARVAPYQKLELVNAMRAVGHYVAVTGDGVNDAPALRTANIGVAMGQSGTDVAREAAELVISDDNFATIVKGVKQGRIAYENIRKVIFMLISTGAAEVVVVTLAVATGFPLPLTPVQLLWMNLVTQGIQDVSMGFEHGEGDELKRKPRDVEEPIFNHLMIERSAFIAVWIGTLAFILFQQLLQAGVALESARNVLLLFIVLFVNIHMFNCRSETKSAFKTPLMQNPVLLFGVLGAFLSHVLVMYLPVGQLILKTQPVDGKTWLLVVTLASTSILLMEWHKRWWNKRQVKKALKINSHISN
ncbi:MAG: HAD-IC family P-type ATPase [Nitrospinae bacterium]|nr:HAD-IC family P-type ATPase [Nitrospinota bacterium]MBL7021055.1 HAD-IC family P-type ATPase [Nitrospinaceae bacterium]